jgi:hypothetical protein
MPVVKLNSLRSKWLYLSLGAVAALGLGAVAAVLIPRSDPSTAASSPQSDGSSAGRFSGANNDTNALLSGPRGLQLNSPKASRGYTLLAPLSSKLAYLLDMDGRIVNTWKTDNIAMNSSLLENGNLLRLGELDKKGDLAAPDIGVIQEFSWDGELVWDYKFISDTHQVPTHDLCKLPNGNLLMVVWEHKSIKETLDAGRNPDTVNQDAGYLVSDCVIEVEPTGKTTGKIVWEWHAWDHLVQSYDDKKTNYGDVAAHPEMIDVNYVGNNLGAMTASPDDLAKLRAVGYIGAGGQYQRPVPGTPVWLHTNSVAYNADLDQIMLSVYEFSEIWIVDHSTTTDEAAAHEGGRYGKGGDLLYRWGNPRTYRAGTVKDQKLFAQHNAHWIPSGLPGEGHVLIFNNGVGRLGGAYSSVDEIVLPVDDAGHYADSAAKSFGPDKPVWNYAAPKRADFYAAVMSGAQRLPNGNTLICSGPDGFIFEVTADGEIVWKYLHVDALVGNDQAFQYPGAPPAMTPGMGRGGGGVFRAPRYGPDYPGLAGKQLSPGKTVEQAQQATTTDAPR